jgi:hypothetical protein
MSLVMILTRTVGGMATAQFRAKDREPRLIFSQRPWFLRTSLALTVRRRLGNVGRVIFGVRFFTLCAITRHIGLTFSFISVIFAACNYVHPPCQRPGLLPRHTTPLHYTTHPVRTTHPFQVLLQSMSAIPLVRMGPSFRSADMYPQDTGQMWRDQTPRSHCTYPAPSTHLPVWGRARSTSQQ